MNDELAIFIVWNNKKYIYWSLSLVPNTEVLNSLLIRMLGESSVFTFHLWPKFLAQRFWNCCNFQMIRALGASFVLIFDLSFWYRASEFLRISWVIGVSFVLMRQFWMDCCLSPGSELVTRKTKPWLEAWNFQPHSLILSERREVLKMELVTDHVYVMKPPLKPR